MALKNLKSDLSQINKPLKTDPMVNRNPVPKIPNISELGVSKFIESSTELSEIPKIQNKPTPNIETNKSKYGVSNNIETGTNKNQPKSLLELYKTYIDDLKINKFNQTDNKASINLRVINDTTGNISNKQIVEVSNNSLIFGRNFSNVNVFDNIKQRPKLGLDVFDRTKVLKKTGIEVFDRTKVQTKLGLDILNNIKVIPKKGLTILNNITVAKKIGIVVVDNIKVVPKTGKSVIDNMKVALKTGLDVFDNINVVPKTGLDVFDNTNVVPKTGLDVFDNTHILPKTGVTVPNPINIPKPSIVDVSSQNIPNKPSIVDITSPNQINKSSIVDINNPIQLPKNSINVPNNQRKLDWNKQSLFGIDSMHMPTGMVARLFSDIDVPYRLPDLKTNEGFPTIILKNKTLSTLIDAEYLTRPSIIDNMLIRGSKGVIDRPNSGESGMPIIQRKIGNTYYGPQLAPGCSVELIRGGIITHANRIAEDIKRIGGWQISMCGLLWTGLQAAMQLTNPFIERPFLTAPGNVNVPRSQTEGVNYNKASIKIAPAGLPWNRIFNPLSTIVSITGQSFGIHPQRHGIFGVTPNYEEIVINNNKRDLNSEWNDSDSYDKKYSNRLLRMWNEFQFNKPSDERNEDRIKPGGLNTILSGWGGPNSLYGIGSTNIYSSTSGLAITKYDKGSKLLLGAAKLLGIKPLSGNTSTDSLQTNYFYLRTYSNEISISEQNSFLVSGFSNIKNYKTYIPGDVSTISPASLIYPDDNSKPTSVGVSPLIVDVDSVNIYNPDVTAYNTLRYNDLDDDKKVRLPKNNRGNVEGGTSYGDNGLAYSNPIKSDIIKWSTVGKVYKAKYGDSYKTIHDPNGSNIPDTGQTDKLYYEEGLTPKISNDIITLLICNTQFRALLKSLNYRFSPDWSDVKYLGRPDKVYLYGGVDRAVDFSFIAAAGSDLEMGIIWKHLNELGQKVSPVIKGNRMVAPIYTLTIGNFIIGEYGFLSGLDYSIEEDYIWDIDEHKLPMYVSVNCSFTIIGKESPHKGAHYFANSTYYNKYKELAKITNPTEEQKITETVGKPANPSGKGQATGLSKNQSTQENPKIDKKISAQPTSTKTFNKNEQGFYTQRVRPEDA